MRWKVYLQFGDNRLTSNMIETELLPFVSHKIVLNFLFFTKLFKYESKLDFRLSKKQTQPNLFRKKKITIYLAFCHIICKYD